MKFTSIFQSECRQIFFAILSKAKYLYSVQFLDTELFASTSILLHKLNRKYLHVLLLFITFAV